MHLAGGYTPRREDIWQRSEDREGIGARSERQTNSRPQHEGVALHVISRLSDVGEIGQNLVYHVPMRANKC